MSELERLKQNIVMDANGNKDEAFNIACRRLLYWYHNASPGFVREAPYKPGPAKVRAEPVLLDSERG